MTTSLALAVGQLAVLSRKEEAVEVAILAAVVILLLLVLVIYGRSRRKNKASVRASAEASSPQWSFDGGQALPGATQVAPLGPADPLDTLGSPSALATITEDPPAAPEVSETDAAGSAAPVTQPAGPDPAPVAPAVEVGTPGAPEAEPVGTPLVANPPAGWLPDPSGHPDTLRYWDGVAWTAHVAQRV